MSRGYISLRAAIGVIRTVERLGVEPQTLWSVLDVDPRAAADPDAVVSGNTVYSLWEAAFAALPRPDLGVEVARNGRRPANDVFGFVLLTSPTGLHAIESAIRFVGLRSTLARWAMSCEGEWAFVTQSRDGPDRLGRTLAIEATLAEVCAVTREILRRPDLSFAVEIDHEAMGRVEAHQAFFGGEVCFGARRNAIRMPRALLEEPLPKSDAGLFEYFQAQAQQALVRISGASGKNPILDQVREHVLRGLPAAPTIDQAAELMHLSSRTLRRRLLESGYSFQAIVDEVRAGVAQEHLARSELAIGEVAYMLGFSEASAFHRAFRRWTGRTPREFRELVRATRGIETQPA